MIGLFTILGRTGVRRPTSSRRTRPSFETLERRDALTGTITYVASTDTVHVDGTNQNDVVEIHVVKQNLVVSIGDQNLNRLDARDPRAINTVFRSFPLTQVAKVVFTGLDGHDQFFNESSKPSVAYGGKGEDMFFGGGGNDKFYGDADRDSLFARGGDDLLRGGTENDWLDGGAGKDKLLGEQGDDELSGGADDDVLDGGIGLDRLDGGAGNDSLDGGYLLLIQDGGPSVKVRDQAADVLTGGIGADKFKEYWFARRTALPNGRFILIPVREDVNVDFNAAEGDTVV